MFIQKDNGADFRKLARKSVNETMTGWFKWSTGRYEKQIVLSLLVNKININPFVPNALSVYSLKTSENLTVF